ncbi:hypothetical protein [Coxiella burnetii]|nr:hypothetical protein [Coxiella burnetii]ABX77970.1 hypothetical protein COXBURSA331_A2218 [Coxiella burnetii RSA 331]AIT64302.1 hypothetical protein CBNA_2123 [Coxiella burnetii str. Namibia]EDR34969.1 hypothetical protein COXBURSA334_2252 [Coxiella burnetii Q321]
MIGQDIGLYHNDAKYARISRESQLSIQLLLPEAAIQYGDNLP